MLLRPKPLMSLSSILTLAILALPIESYVKALMFLLVWFFCLRPFRKIELAVFVVVNLICATMDAEAIKNNLFYFKNPDLMSLPFWEFFMWGYFAILSYRLCPNLNFRFINLLLLIAFQASFALVKNQELLLGLSSAATLALLFFAGRPTWIVAIWALVFGITFEWIGSLTNQWGYLQYVDFLKMPWWGIPMWVGSWVIFAAVIFPLGKLQSKFII